MTVWQERLHIGYMVCIVTFHLTRPVSVIVMLTILLLPLNLMDEQGEVSNVSKYVGIVVWCVRHSWADVWKCVWYLNSTRQRTTIMINAEHKISFVRLSLIVSFNRKIFSYKSFYFLSISESIFLIGIINTEDFTLISL